MFNLRKLVLCMATLLLVGFPRPTFAQSQKEKKKEKSEEGREVLRIAAFSSQIEAVEITPKAGGKANAVFQMRPGIKLSAETRRRFTELKASTAGPGRFKAEIAFDFEAFAGEQQRRAD